MWTDDKSSDDDEQYFLLHFNPELKHLTGHSETDSIFYTDSEFSQMVTACGRLSNITYLDIYPVVLPSDTLSLLFVPKNSQYQPLAYYRLTPGSTSFPGAGDVVNSTDAGNWIKKFHDRISKLDGELDKTDPTNYVYCTPDPANFSNTIYLHHPYLDFTELHDEVIYQKSLGNTISGVKAFFAARPDATPNLNTASKRLHVILEFTMEDDVKHPHRRFRITPGDRIVQGPSFPIFGNCAAEHLLRDSLGGNNNGQMCPPACNP